MSTLLAPLPDHDPLKVSEVAAALGMGRRIILVWLHDGRFPGAFRNPGENGPGHWRIPHATAAAVRAELGIEP